MRNLVISLLAGAVLMTSAARGDFTEDWESYSHSDEISSQTVWYTAGTTGGQIFKNSGESGIYAACCGGKERDAAASMGAGNWTWGTAFRQIAEPNSPIVATARVYLEPSAYHAIRVGFSPHVETGGNGGGGRAEGPIIELRLQADNVGDAQWNMRTTDEGAGEADTFAPAQTDTWYEIRLTTNTDNSVTGEYRQMNILPGPPRRKLLASGPWVEIDTMDAMGTWNANYLYISGLRQGHIDDIKVSGRPYWGGDVNRDFHVDIKDVAQQAMDWLNCNDPFQPVPCTDVP